MRWLGWVATAAMVSTLACSGDIGGDEPNDDGGTSNVTNGAGTNSGGNAAAGGMGTGAGMGTGGNGSGAGMGTGGNGSGAGMGTGGNGSGGMGTGGDGGNPPGPTGCTASGLALIAEVNNYRAANGLAPVTASSSMCIVAENHVADTVNNNPDVGQCNLHSWSNQGPWTPCCYTPDHAQAQCMWDKPRELSMYTGNGYEISASGVGTPQAAVNAWSGSPGHNAVMLNSPPTWTTPWLAMGAAINNGVAHVWFGHQADPMP